MGTLYLDRKALSLRLETGRLVIEEPGERPRGVPLKLLERVVIQGRATLDSGLLVALGEHGVSVLCLSARHSRRAGFLLGPGHADARRRLAQYRLSEHADLRLEWSRALVAGKLRAQRQLLNDALAWRPDCRKPLYDAIQQLERLLAQLPSALDLNAVRGVEGAAAAGYFAGLTQLFAPALNFTGRNRRPPRDPVNACLSLGYTLLHTEAARAGHQAGLDPLLGFFHDPAYGRESLACDLIEPLRPRLDGWVWDLFRGRALRRENFIEDKGACLLNKTGRQTYFAAFESAAPRWRRYLRQQAYRLARLTLALAPDLALADGDE